MLCILAPCGHTVCMFLPTPTPIAPNSCLFSPWLCGTYLVDRITFICFGGTAEANAMVSSPCLLLCVAWDESLNPFELIFACGRPICLSVHLCVSDFLYRLSLLSVGLYVSLYTTTALF